MITFAGGAVSWLLKLQKCVALSSTKDEFIDTTEPCKEMIWVKRFLNEFEYKHDKYMVHCDRVQYI